MWHDNSSVLGVFVALVFYVLGSILFIAQMPPGSYLVGSLLYLFASIVLFLSYMVAFSTSYSVYTQTLPFANAASAVYAPAQIGDSAVPAAAPAGAVAPASGVPVAAAKAPAVAAPAQPAV